MLPQTSESPDHDVPMGSFPYPNNFALVLLYGKWCMFLMDEKAKSLRPLNSGLERVTSEKHQVVYNTPPLEWGAKDLNPYTPHSRPEIKKNFLATKPIGKNCPGIGLDPTESHCWRALNTNGLDPYIGFMHQTVRGKAPLIYDMQEPFRWLCDVAVISAMEKKVFNKKDFVITENYNIRIRPNGVKKLMGELNSQFSKKVIYRNRNWEWGYVINQKARELAKYLEGKRKTLDFSSPKPNPKRQDKLDMRERILKISYKEWEKRGYSKGTLHYLKKNVRSGKPFTMNEHVRGRIEGWG